MKNVFILWMLILFANIKAQNKFPMPGADWHYMTLEGLGSVYPSYNSHIEIKYTKDTLINGVTAAVIGNSSSFSEINNTNSNYFYSSNDSVFLYNKYTSHQWQLLYSFNTPVGQSWQFTIQPIFSSHNNTTWIVRVDSVNNVIINSNTLKRLFVTYIDSAGICQSYTSSIVERIGDVNYLINILDYGLGGWCDGCTFITGVLCYQDSSFNLYQPDTSKPCNYYTLDIKQQAINNEQLNVYPNPAQNSLQVTVNTGYIVQCILYDMLGNEVISTKVEEIDVSNLQNGVYFLQVKIDEGIITKKIIIQR